MNMVSLHFCDLLLFRSQLHTQCSSYIVSYSISEAGKYYSHIFSISNFAMFADEDGNVRVVKKNKDKDKAGKFQTTENKLHTNTS